MLGSIVMFGKLTCCALLYSICNLNDSQIYVQCCWIQDLILCIFKLGHNIMETIENIYSVEGECAIERGTVTRWLKKFHLDCKNCNDQQRSYKTKESNDSEVVLLAIVASPVSSTWRVSSQLAISQSIMVCHLHVFSKSIQNGWIVARITKIWQFFYLS